MQVNYKYRYILLPPAYVRTTGGYVFTGVCLFNFRGGYPISGLMVGWYPISDLMVEGYPIPGLMVGGYPIPGLMVGGTPSQVWMVGDGGYPGYPPGQVWMVGRYPGYPPGQVWMVGGTQGTPHHDWMGYPPPTSIASTCYAAGGMPLAFTQEDFLVVCAKTV